MMTFIAILLSTAWAQLPLAPEHLMKVPELNVKKALSTKAEEFQKWPSIELEAKAKPPYQEKQVTELALRLESQFKKALQPLQQSVPACGDPLFENYILALHVAGRLDECTQQVRSCAGGISGPKPFLTAALCSSTRFHYKDADHFFALATDSRWATSPDYTESLFQAASYSLYGHHEKDVDGFLAKIPNAPKSEQILWKALLQRIGEIDTGGILRKDIDDFLAMKIQTAAPDLKGLLLSLQIRLDMRESRHDQAIQRLFALTSEIPNPLQWYYNAYSALYQGLGRNFSWSRKIYDVYNSYAYPWMSFPLESNTYNYSQIYSKVCAKNLIQKNESVEWEKIKKGLRSGEVSINAAIERLDLLKSTFGTKADFLTTYAGLLSLQGNRSEAFQLYWQAHQICPYYNRAHWGLAIEKRFLQYVGRPDFDQLNGHIDRELQGRPVPTAIADYFVNWSSLNPDIQKRIVYGSRIWLPYMETLRKNQLQTYIKYGFDLLSESPNLEDMRDERIGGSLYPNDNRLWDDVRGVGGPMVVADLSEVYQTVQGDYNLLGHEMAHQFQLLVENTSRPVLSCIQNQFDQAKQQQNFPDAYSSQNKEEHFAQGVTYFMVPADSPARFGLNQNWVKTKNPAQFYFIQSIDEARGNLNLISCQP